LRRPQAEWLLLFGLAGGLIVALVYQFLRYPYYGHGRASYLLTGMVPLCALGALGLDFLARFHRVLGFVLVILLGTWAGTVYTSFWIDPNGAATHNWAGEQLLKSKLPFQAQQCFRKAIEVDPAFVPARFNLANTLLLTNQRTRAREETEAILRNHPDHADALLLLAILCHREGQTQAALDQLRRACRAAPDHPVVYSASAGFLMEQGQEEEAITAFRQALRVNPASATDHANLGLLLVRMGSLEEAITQYGCAMDLQPDHPEWRADLAWILATRLPPRSKPYATLAVDE
jgi:Tfp pilus assembly protein PilF